MRCASSPVSAVLVAALGWSRLTCTAEEEAERVLFAFAFVFAFAFAFAAAGIFGVSGLVAAFAADGRPLGRTEVPGFGVPR